MGALVGTLLLGRDLVLYTTTWQQINLAALGVAVALAAGAAWTLRGTDGVRDDSVPIGGD
jgi:cytochrome c oxidase assembly protein subunit 15